MNDRQYQKFVINELVRFYDSQRHHGKAYLQATLRIWEENSKFGRMAFVYKEAVRRIHESKLVNP